MALDACSIGIFCKDSNSCHKTSFIRKVGLDLIQNLTYEEKECLLWRSNVQRMNASQDTTLTVCYHHKRLFLLNLHASKCLVAIYWNSYWIF